MRAVAAGEGLRRAREARNREAEIRFLYCRADTREQLSTPQDALADYGAGIELAHAVESHRLLALGLVARGDVYSMLDERGTP